MSNITVRKLEKADAEDFLALRIRSLETHQGAFLSTPEEARKLGADFFAEVMTRNPENEAIFGAFDNNKLIGIAGIYRKGPHKAYAHKSEVWGTYVAPEYQGKGISKDLMDHLIQFARDNGTKIVILAVEAANKPALKLYEKLGFKMWGKEPCASIVGGSCRDDIYMSLMLDKDLPS